MPTPVKLFVEVGQRIGRGVVTEPEIRIPHSRQGTQRAARLICDCGTVYEVAIGSLLKGHTKSCGCLRRDYKRNISPDQLARMRIRNSTHGQRRHPLYKTWWNAIERCHNPKSPSWRNYGARGISVCPDWHDVAEFIGWIDANLGPRPKGCSLDRIDGTGDYRPGNVRWATAAQQSANRRSWGRRPNDLQIQADILAAAAARAKAERVSLAEVATMLLREYANGHLRLDLAGGDADLRKAEFSA